MLDRLAERPAWRMGELATALHVDPSAVTRAVLSLEAGGLVERTRDPDDRRCVLVQATALGRARHALARMRGLQLWDEGLEQFTDAEIEAFAMLMERLTRSFTDLLLGEEKDAGPA